LGSTSLRFALHGWQRVHEAIRLQVMCEAGTGMLTRIYERQPALQELIGNGWLLLSAKDPMSGRISVFDPRKGWTPWQGEQETPPETDCSSDWYAGHRQPLAPALVRQAFTS
ncbi:putative inorganic carbon transporter subunit DabA, partial [Thiolapillus sp.]|uniref:putative inorganic carbon transporter subunit DabA n=1 Tax=Thiolapillus sp. TaxID=2017437 RepID=UPI003AF8A701